ncbi:MAG TPA: CBS domain-containing protein [Thermoleophilaceae bacterium]|nr:CBS domain-containing protein [Thermoleophilaceae bacterium]
MTEERQEHLVALGGSYLTPSFEHARVADAMRAGVVTCPPETSMAAVARIMASNHVHAVVVTGLADGPPWGVVSDRDLLAVAAEAEDRLAGSCAGTELVTVAPGEPLRAAVELMRRHGVTHVLVGDPQSGPPIGVLSTLDVAGIVAWGRG